MSANFNTFFTSLCCVYANLKTLCLEVQQVQLDNMLYAILAVLFGSNPSDGDFKITGSWRICMRQVGRAILWLFSESSCSSIKIWSIDYPLYLQFIAIAYSKNDLNSRLLRITNFFFFKSWYGIMHSVYVFLLKQKRNCFYQAVDYETFFAEVIFHINSSMSIQSPFLVPHFHKRNDP